LRSAQHGRGTKLKAGLELVTVNPSLVLGPVLGSDFSASLEAVRKLLDGSILGLPHVGFSVGDVRDIAALQLLAMTTPRAAGQRFIGSCDFYWMADIAKILKQGLGDKARKFPSISVPDFPVRVIRIFDPVARGRLYELGKRRQGSPEDSTNVGVDDAAGPGDHSRQPKAFRRRAWCRSRGRLSSVATGGNCQSLCEYFPTLAQSSTQDNMKRVGGAPIIRLTFWVNRR
jgi:hypothetical protein